MVQKPIRISKAALLSMVEELNNSGMGFVEVYVDQRESAQGHHIGIRILENRASSLGHHILYTKKFSADIEKNNTGEFILIDKDKS